MNSIMIKKIAYNLLGEKYSWLAVQHRQLRTYCYSVFHPYHYNPSRYGDSFLDKPCEFEFSDDFSNHIERVIYIFWTGDNEITPNRMQGIHSLEKVSGAKVQLITSKNLSEYIKEDDPLPEAYQYLSFVHRADYLRSYFMYHYGGGYADIKTYFKSWIPAFEKLEKSEAYVIGYPEVGFWGAACHDIKQPDLKSDVFTYWRYLIGNGAYICRPYTRFTAEWHQEAKQRLIVLAEALKKHPAVDPFGKTYGYPVKWSWLLGAVFHPLCLKYHEKLMKDKALMPSFENYR